MPVITNINLALDMNQVLRHEAIAGKSRLTPQIKSLLGDLLDIISSDHLMRPSIAYNIYPVIEIRADGVQLEGNVTLRGSLFRSTLTDAKELAIAVGTIGPGLEGKAIKYFNRKESLRGTLLDGIGSVAVDLLSEEAAKLITAEAASRGYQSSSPVNPGMPGFPVSEQKQLLTLVPVKDIGVRLTSSGMMSPRKSVSLIIGMGPQMPVLTQAKICARCHSGKTCRYRARA